MIDYTLETIIFKQLVFFVIAILLHPHLWNKHCDR